MKESTCVFGYLYRVAAGFTAISPQTVPSASPLLVHRVAMIRGPLNTRAANTRAARTMAAKSEFLAVIDQREWSLTSALDFRSLATCIFCKIIKGRIINAVLTVHL